MKDTNYFCVQSWMVTKLHLKGAMRDVFAIIYGFTQDDESECKCSYSYMSEITGYSKRAVIDAIDELLDLAYIIKIPSRSATDQRNIYKCSYSYIDAILTGEPTSPPSELSSPPSEPTSPPPSEPTSPHNINININKEFNKEFNKSTGPGASVRHPRNFSKETLTDDLQSGKDIDEQKKEKKKISEYDKCYKEIDDRYTDKNINSLLHQHLDWSYYSKDPQRLRSLKVFKKRLDELDSLDNKEEVVKQSLQKQWHCFYNIGKSSSAFISHSDSHIRYQTLSAEEAKALLAKETEEYGTI